MQTMEFNFQNQKIEIDIIENNNFEFLLTTKEVAKGYGVSIENIRSQKSNHKDELLEEKHFLNNFSFFDGKQHRKTTLWTKRGVIRLGFFIKSERAKKFRDWAEDLVLEKIENNSQNSQQPQPDQNIVNNIFALEKSFVNLRPSEASKISMTEKLYKKLKLETNYLPKYTEEKLTRSLTYLLKKYEIKLSTQKANLKLLELGILEKKERDSSCGNKKYFYSITENGLKFGKNLISPKNERETQPHFYESKFLELMKLF
jgi:prophage antirepressor-like protein